MSNLAKSISKTIKVLNTLLLLFGGIFMLQGCSIGSWEGGAGVGGAFQALGFWFLAIFLFILSGWAIFLKKISNSKHNTTQPG